MFLRIPADRSMEELISEGDVITKKEIKVWFSENRTPFDDNIISTLQTILNQIRISVSPLELLSLPEVEAFDQFKRAVAFILEYTPSSIASMEKVEAGSSSERQGSPFSSEAIEATKALLAAANRVSATLLPRRIGKRIAAWHQDAIFLAHLFDGLAVRLGRRFSFTKPTSPAVLIICAALQRAGVSGLPDDLPEAFAKAMKRERANPTPPAIMTFGGGTNLNPG